MHVIVTVYGALALQARDTRSDPSLYYNVSSPQLGPLYQCISAHACLEHAAVYHCMHEVRGVTTFMFTVVSICKNL